MVDQAKIRQKIHFIRVSLDKLERIREYSFEEFHTEPFVADACLRNMQIVIEALLDIGNHIIARQALGLPKTYGDVIRILVEHGILEVEREEAYVRQARFRDRIVHIYDDVSMEEAYDILQTKLEDVREFVTAIVRFAFSEQ